MYSRIRQSLLGDTVQPIDYSEGALVGANAQQQKSTVSEARQRLLSDANQKHQQRIQGEAAANQALEESLRAQGEEYRPAQDISSMGLTAEQQYQRYLQGQGDARTEWFVNRASIGEIEAIYGKAVAEDVRRRRQQRVEGVQEVGQYIPEDERSSLYSPKAIGGGVARGLVNLAGSLGNVASALSNAQGVISDEDAAETAEYFNNAVANTNKDLARFQGNRFELENDVSGKTRELAKKYQQDRYNQLVSQTGDAVAAKSQADSEASELDRDLSIISGELMANGIYEQIPEIVVAALTGGLGASVGAGVVNTRAQAALAKHIASKGFTKEAAEKLSRRIAKKIAANTSRGATIGAGLAVGSQVGTREGISTGFEAQNDVLDYYQQAKERAAQGDSSVLDEMRSTPQWREYKNANPNLTDDEIAIALSNSAFRRGAAISGGASFAVNAAMSPLMGYYGSQAVRNLGLPARTMINAFTEAGSEPLEEFVEETANALGSQIGSNTATGVEVNDDPTGFAVNQGINAAKSTLGFGAAGVARAGSGAAVKGVNKALDFGKQKIKSKTTELKKENQATEAKKMQSDIDEHIKQINIMGTSATKDTPAIDGVLLGKNMDNSKFGKVLKEAVEAKHKEAGTKPNGATDTGEFVRDLVNDLNDKINERNTLVQEGKPTKEIDEQISNLNTVRQNLQDALLADITDHSPVLNKASNKVQELIQQYEQAKTPEEQEKIKKEFEEADAELNSLVSQNENAMKVLQSPMYARLSSDTFRAFSDPKNRDMEDTKISLEDYTGKKPRTTDLVFASVRKVSSAIKAESNKDKASSIATAWVDALQDTFNKVTPNNAKTAATRIAESIKELKSALGDTSNKLLNILGEQVNNALDNNLSNAATHSMLTKLLVTDSETKRPSLLRLISDYERNDADGTKAQIQLQQFRASQIGKEMALRNILMNEPRNNDAIGSFKEPITDIKVFGNILKTQDGKPVSFTSAKAVRSYLNTFKSENKVFNDLINSVLKKGDSKVEPIEIPEVSTTQEPKTSQENVVETKIEESTSENQEQEQESSEPIETEEVKVKEKSEVVDDSKPEESKSTTTKDKSVVDTTIQQEEVKANNTGESTETTESLGSAPVEKSSDLVQSTNTYHQNNIQSIVDNYITKRLKNKDNVLEKLGNWNDVAKGQLPTFVKDYLYSHGYLTDKNLFEEHYSKRKDAVSAQDKLDALDQFRKDSSADTTRNLVEKLNPALPKEEIDSLVNEDNLKTTVEQLQLIEKLNTSVNQYLQDGINKLNPSNERGIFNTLSTYNGFTNLYQFDEQGKPVYSAELGLAMTMAGVEAMYAMVNSGSVKNSQMTEYFEGLGTGQYAVFNTTLQNLVFKTSDTKTSKASGEPVMVNPEDLTVIGSDTKILANKFGEYLIDHLGFKANKDIPTNVRYSITQSLGNEVLAMLYAKHMVDTYRVEINRGEDTPKLNLYYAAPSMKSMDPTHFGANRHKLFKAYSEILRGEEPSINTDVNQIRQHLSKLDELNNSWFVNGLMLLALNKTGISKKLFNSTVETLGYSLDKPFSVSISDNANVNVPALPKAVKENLEAHNKIPYRIDKDMRQMFEKHLDVYKIVGGWKDIKAFDKHLPIERERQESINSQVERTIDTISSLLKEVDAVSKDGNAPVYIKHRTTETQRVMQEMKDNPQSNKMMREILKASSKSFKEVEEELAKSNIDFGFDMNEIKEMVRISEIKVSMPKLDKTKKDNRTLEDLIQTAHRALKNSSKETSSQERRDTNRAAYESYTGLLLALAQALGIKVEKLSTEQILNKLRGLFQQDWLNDLVQDIYNVANKPNHKPDPKLYQQLADEYGTGAMRALSVLQAYSKWAHTEGSKQLNFDVYLEADGIGNGISNLFHQFSSGFNKQYFENTAKVGKVHLPVLLEHLKDKDLDSMSDAEKSSLMDDLEGSALLFDSSINKNAQEDVYQTVSTAYANSVVSRFTNYLPDVVQLSPNITFGAIDTFINSLIKEIKSKNGVINKDVQDQLRSSYLVSQTINQLNQIALLEDITIPTKTGMVSLAELNKTKVSDIDLQKLDMLGIKISRGLAKMGVTPKTYGGSVNGVSSQVTKDITKALQNKLNELYLKLQEQSSVDKSDLDLIRLNLGALGVDVQLSDKPTIKDIEKISNAIINSADGIKANIIDSFGKSLHGVIDQVYAGTFTNANTALSFDQLEMSMALFELDSLYKKAVANRNKAKGYKDTDPRRNDLLSTKELTDILKQIRSLGFLGGAFSNHAEMFDQIVQEGHLVAKESLSEFSGTGHTVSNIETVTGSRNTRDGGSIDIYSSFISEVAYRMKQLRAGGALNFTNTVVSTESQVQASTIGLMSALGKSFLNVFDGLDASSHLRKLVGMFANKAYDEVHKDVNLVKEFFNRANRSNVFDILSSSDNKNRDKEIQVIEDLANNKLDEESSITVTPNLILQLRVIDGSLKALGNPAKAKFAYGIDDLENQLRSSGNGKVDVSGSVLNNIFPFEQVSELSDVFKDKNLNTTQALYTHAITKIRDLAASVDAMRAVESEHLIYGVNQFGGANRGIVVNGDKLFKSKGIASKFEQYALAHPEETDVNTLYVDFILGDPEIQSTYRKAYAQSIASMPISAPRVIKEGASIDVISDLRNKLNSQPSIDGMEVVDALEAYYKDAGDSLENSVYNTLIKLFKEFLPKDFKVRKANGKELNLYGTNSGLVAHVNILDNSLVVFDENISPETYMHEFLHAINTAALMVGALDPEVAQAYGYTDKQIAKATAFYNELHREFKHLVDLNKNNPKVIDLLSKGWSISQMYPAEVNVEPVHHDASLAYGRTVQLIAMLAKAVDPQSKATRREKVTAFTEALSFFLGSGEGINMLYYTRQAKPDNTYAKEPWFQRLRKSLARMRSIIVSWVFGSNFDQNQVNNNHASKQSMLISLLTATYAGGSVNYDLAGKVQQTYQNANQPMQNVNSPMIRPFAMVEPQEDIRPLSMHEQRLNEITNKVTEFIGSKELTESNTARIMFADSKIKAMLAERSQRLRNVGFLVTPEEQNTMEALYGALSVSFKMGEFSLRNAASKVVDKLRESSKDMGLTLGQQNALFNFKENPLANTIAILATNEDIQKRFDKVLQDKEVKSFMDRLEDVVFNSDLQKEINSSSSYVDMVNLITDAALKAKIQKIHKDENYRRNQEELERQSKIREDFDKVVTNNPLPMPKSFQTALTAVVRDWARTAELDKNGAKELDSLLGNILEEYHNELVTKNGKNTWVTSVMRWVLQARDNTQRIYDRRARLAASNERVRENVRNVIPAVIIQKFGKENFTEEIDTAIAESVLPTELQSLFTGSNIDEIIGYVKDRTKRETAKASIFNQFKKDLINTHPKEVDAISNWVRWQTKGLGELMIKGTAKSSKAGTSHQILSNARAIADLPLWQRDGMMHGDYSKLYSKYVSKIATLEALNHIDKDKLDSLASMMEEHPAGFSEVLNSKQVVNQYYIDTYGNSVLVGEDGTVYSSFDPNVDISIVEKDSAQYKRQLELGYEPVQDIEGTNYTVLRTDVNLMKRYQTGIFGLADTSIYGINTKSRRHTKSFASTYTGEFLDNFYKLSEAAMKDSNFYDTLKADSSIKPVLGFNGKPKGYDIDIPKSLRKTLITEVQNGIQSLGNEAGRQTEEQVTEKFNADSIKMLNELYKEARDKHNFLKIPLDYKHQVKGNQNADRNFRNRVMEFYESLPIATKDFIQEQGGVYIRATEIDNIIGYHQYDITDIWTGKSTLPEPVNAVLRGVFSIFGLAGTKPIKAAKLGQKGLIEAVSQAKDIILNRSIVVPVQNLLSNVIHALNIGIPYKQLLADTKEGLQAAQAYVNNISRLQELYYLRDKATGTTHADKVQINNEIRQLTDAVENNPAAPLVQKGILSSIAGDAAHEILLGQSGEFSLKNKLFNKLGLNQVNSKFKTTTAGKVVNNLLINEDTEAHDFMVKSLDYGDFVFKYSLFKHLVQNKNMSEEQAINVIREEFVNYTMNRGAAFDYLNAVGLSWFASYAFGIQKIIYKTARRHTRNTAMTYALMKGIGKDLGLQAVIEQNPFEKSWRYAFNPLNLLNTGEAHYLSKLFSMILK